MRACSIYGNDGEKRRLAASSIYSKDDEERLAGRGGVSHSSLELRYSYYTVEGGGTAVCSGYATVEGTYYIYRIKNFRADTMKCCIPHPQNQR